jgi:hypothetical protein
VGEDARQDLRVVLGVVGALLGDAPVAGERGELVVGHVDAEATAQRQRAQPLPHGQLHPGALGLGGQETVVERGVVRYQDAPVEHLDQLRSDLVEAGRRLEALRGEAVDVDRPRVAVGVDERGEPRPLRSTGRVERHGGHTEHPAAVGVQAGGLHIDHRPSVVGVEQPVDLCGGHVKFLRTSSGRTSGSGEAAVQGSASPSATSLRAADPLPGARLSRQGRSSAITGAVEASSVAARTRSTTAGDPTAPEGAGEGCTGDGVRRRGGRGRVGETGKMDASPGDYRRQ